MTACFVLLLSIFMVDSIAFCTVFANSVDLKISSMSVLVKALGLSAEAPADLVLSYDNLLTVVTIINVAQIDCS